MKAYAYFPFAVANYVDDFSNGEISVKFKPMTGKIDQAAGIIFNVKTNGDYLIVRANALEENLVLFKYIKGKAQLREVDQERSDATKTVAHPESGDSGKEGKGISGRQALAGAYAS